MRRGQRTFRPDNKEGRHMYYRLFAQSTTSKHWKKCSCFVVITGLAAAIIIVIAVSVGLCVAAIGILTIRRSAEL